MSRRIISPSDLTPKNIRNFWKYVAKGSSLECWIWIGSRNEDGYGQISFLGRTSGWKGTKAHRVSYFLAHPGYDQSKHILHKCDNPSCVNPSHLFIGTNADNVADSVLKGRRRGAEGERNCHHKLTVDQVRTIRWLIKCGIFNCVIARKFSVHRETIRLIANGTSWSSLQ